MLASGGGRRQEHSRATRVFGADLPAEGATDRMRVVATKSAVGCGKLRLAAIDGNVEGTFTLKDWVIASSGRKWRFPKEEPC